MDAIYGADRSTVVIEQTVTSCKGFGEAYQKAVGASDLAGTADKFMSNQPDRDDDCLRQLARRADQGRWNEQPPHARLLVAQAAVCFGLPTERDIGDSPDVFPNA